MESSRTIDKRFKRNNCEIPRLRNSHLWHWKRSIRNSDTISNALSCFLNVSANCNINRKKISQSEAKRIIAKAEEKEKLRRKAFANFAEIYDPIQICIAWNTIYDPSKNRIISPVSRIWSYGNGGYILFCWDNFFAAVLASIDNKDLAYANALAILNEATDAGFVPNVSAANGFKSLDRSQPPVGSICCLDIFKKYEEKNFLLDVFEPLLKWNRWWIENRDTNGLLCRGLNFYEPITGNEWETAKKGVNQRFGAALESGLDNSHQCMTTFRSTKNEINYVYRMLV